MLDYIIKRESSGPSNMVFFHSATLFMSLAVTVAADYECLCNYNVETPVYSIADNHGQAIGHMYEFDCKPTDTTYKPDGWLAIQFEGKVGYVALNVQLKVQTCPGTLPGNDKVNSAKGPTTLTPSDTLKSSHQISNATGKYFDTTDRNFDNMSTTQKMPITTEYHFTEKSTFHNTGQLNLTTAHTSSDATTMVNSSRVYTKIPETVTRSIYSSTFPKFESSGLETGTLIPPSQAGGITSNKQATVSTNGRLTETTASLTVAATTIGMATTETGRGKTYLCPFMVKHNTQMQYLAQHGNYCYELYPYDPKDWMSGMALRKIRTN